MRSISWSVNGWQWAEEDFRSAEHLLTLREPCPLGTVCFHGHQCAEKYLKAPLTLQGVPFPKTHDLLELRRRVPKQVKLTLPLKELSMINRYAIEARYPGDWEPITRAEAEEAVAIAGRVRGAVRAHLPKGAPPGQGPQAS